MSSSDLITSRKFETYEQYVAWYEDSYFGRKNMLSRTEWKLRQPPQARLAVISAQGRPEVRVPLVDGKFRCPACSSDDVFAYPDGSINESEGPADWWECGEASCYTWGAVLHAELPRVTQNGIPLMGYSPFPAA